MSPSEPSAPPRGAPAPAAPHAQASRYSWFVGLAALLVIAVIATHNFAASGGAAGIAVGQPIPPFAVPLALGTLTGDANVATRPDDGAAGRIPACDVHLAQALNICEAYARGPLVLALFVDAGACPAVLAELRRIAPSYPGLRVAAVAITGDRGALRALVLRERLGYPVGYDHDGILGDLYHVSSCPQVSFVRPGGTVAEPALLGNAATAATLQTRIASLVADARARGWRPAA